MALSSIETEALLAKARKHIGKPYADMDCSHFVWQSFQDAGKIYPYHNTATFDKLVDLGYFMKLDKSIQPLDGDLLMFKSHIGFWDSKGCLVIVSDSACKASDNKAPFLSSRSGNNRGPSFGKPIWWGEVKSIYRWNKS